MTVNFKIAKWAKTLLILFFSTLFIFSRVRAAVVINEVMYGDQNSTKNEFVELYNTGSSSVTLDKYKLTKKTASGSESNLVSSAKFVGSIAGHGYFVIAYPDYKNAINANLSYSGSSYSIAADNSVLLYDASGKLVDAVGYGKATFFETLAAPDFAEGQSIGRLDGNDTDNNNQDFSVQDPTPGKENKKMEEKIPDAPKIYSDKIEINELYPYPNAGEEEFIELYNGGATEEDLFGWSLHDASKTGEYDFKQHEIISAKGYLVLYSKKDFSFALNNSGGESVTLRDGNGVVISAVSYDSAKMGTSYDFDGSAWHWSKFVSPGEANIFEDVPDGGLNLPSEVFVGVYADFSLSGLESGAKATWDFGDGHKSYLVSTKHKFEKEGNYNASVTYSHGSEDETKNFEINVQEIPHPKLKIVTINANPAGADTGKESLTIQNKTKKKVNLSGWSIATCWKKCINHPIREDFRIKGKKSKDIKGDISSFTLNNTKAKIELRYPDGKVAQRVKYKKKTGTIADGEIYQKVKGGWVWQLAKQETIAKETSPKNIQNSIASNQNSGNQSSVIGNQKTTDNIQQQVETVQDTKDTINNQNKLSPVTGQQSSNADINNAKEIVQPVKEEVESRKENKIAKGTQLPLSWELSSQTKIELLKNIAATGKLQSLREADGQYFFTPELTRQDHYMITFWKSFSSNLNVKINSLLNFLIK